METTTPDWVFSVALSGLLLAAFSAAVWGLLFALTKTHVPTVPDSSLPWLRRVRLHGPLFLSGSVLVIHTVRDPEILTAEHEPLIWTVTLASLTYVGAGLALAVRRVNASGPLPTATRAPLGIFWVTPILFLTALMATSWAATAMIISTRPC